AELAGDEDTRHGGFEGRRHERNVDPAPLAAEDEGDGIDRTRGLARAMTDAVAGAHQMGAPPEEAEDRVVRLLGAGLDAGRAADAVIGDHRVERCGFRRAGFLLRLRALVLESAPAPHVPHEHQSAKAQEKTDRKSTRLNSSHVASSYAVLRLKKKNRRKNTHPRQ